VRIISTQESEGQASVVHDHVPEVRINPDIPDMANKDVPKAVLSEEQARERNVRRYTRKDGMFVKNYQNLFDVLDRIDGNNRMIYKATKTAKEATEFIIDLCIASGRTVSEDIVTKRLKATPGWNLEITCPGMESVEQNAHVETESVVRQKRTDMLLEQSQAQNATMVEQIKTLSEAVANLTGNANKTGDETAEKAEAAIESKKAQKGRSKDGK